MVDVHRWIVAAPRRAVRQLLRRSLKAGIPEQCTAPGDILGHGIHTVETGLVLEVVLGARTFHNAPRFVIEHAPVTLTLYTLQGGVDLDRDSIEMRNKNLVYNSLTLIG